MSSFDNKQQISSLFFIIFLKFNKDLANEKEEKNLRYYNHSVVYLCFWLFTKHHRDKSLLEIDRNTKGAIGDDEGDDIYKINLKNGWKFKIIEIIENLKG